MFDADSGPARAGASAHIPNTVTRIREDFIFDFLLVQNSWRAPSMNLSLLPGRSLN